VCVRERERMRERERSNERERVGEWERERPFFGSGRAGSRGGLRSSSCTDIVPPSTGLWIYVSEWGVESMGSWQSDDSSSSCIDIMCYRQSSVWQEFVTDLDNSLSSHTSMSSGMNGWVTGGEAWIELVLSCLCQQVGALGSCKLTTDKHIWLEFVRFIDTTDCVAPLLPWCR